MPRFLFLLLVLSTQLNCASAKNVILFIGDGMGPEQVRSARLFLGQPLSFETMPVKGLVRTDNIQGSCTDSAAAATAMATGQKVANYELSWHAGKDLETILEKQQQAGRWTGLVTTTDLTDATPAAFAAHVPTRLERRQISEQYFNVTRPNLLMGADGRNIFPRDAKEAGYQVATDAAAMLQFGRARFSEAPHIYVGLGTYLWYGWMDLNGLPIEIEDHYSDGRYFRAMRGGHGLPHLTEMTQTALNVLGQAPEGFFLMIESANIDCICHAADMFDDEDFTPSGVEALTYEVLELARAVEIALSWAKDRDDTLIIVTADHETGGLEIEHESAAGQFARAKWTSPHYLPGERLEEYYRRHTNTPVPIYAWGVGAERFEGEQENSEIFDKCYELSLSHQPANTPQIALKVSTKNGVQSPKSMPNKP